MNGFLLLTALSLTLANNLYSQEFNWGNEIYFRTVADDSTHQTCASYNPTTNKWKVEKIAYSPSEIKNSEPGELSRHQLLNFDGPVILHEFQRVYLLDKRNENRGSYLLEENHQLYGESNDGNRLIKILDHIDLTMSLHYQFLQSDTCYFYSNGLVKYALKLVQ